MATMQPLRPLRQTRPIRPTLSGLMAASVVLGTWLPAGAVDSTPMPPEERGLLMRQGEWGQEVGSYLIPPALEKVKPSAWPTDGWHRIAIVGLHVELRRVQENGKNAPAFLSGITAQVNRARANPAIVQESAPQPDHADELFLRVPGVRLVEGPVPAYRFKNGTTSLVPELERRYALDLNGQPFAFTARNGSRGKNGAPYGEGANYTIEYGGQVFNYNLGGYGWDSRVLAIADLDGDSKPDFIVAVSVSNGSYEAVLLSSTARPGTNVPTASLRGQGC